MIKSSTAHKKPAGVKRTVSAASSENDTVNGIPKPFSSSSKGNALNRVKSGYVSKKTTIKITAEKQAQTDHPDVELVTGDTPTLEYWKLLAEEREKTINEIRTEKVELKEANKLLSSEVQELKEQNIILQEENKTLETMLEDSKRMAEYFESIPDESDEDETD